MIATLTGTWAERIKAFRWRADIILRGSSSSGNYGHAGRPGIRGGSAEGGGAVEIPIQDRFRVEPRAYSVNQESLSTSDGAETEFHRALRAQYGPVIPLFHESPIKNLDSILRSGLTEEANFATVGEPSGFVSGDKVIVRFSVGANSSDMIVPDMRYDPDNAYADLLKEHNGVAGADVSYNDSVALGRIHSLIVVRGNKVAEVIRPSYKKSATPDTPSGGHNPPLSEDERLLYTAVRRVLRAQVAEVHGRVEAGEKVHAVSVDSREWDKRVVDDVRPAWYRSFKRGGDEALKRVRTRKGEQVEVVCVKGEAAGHPFRGNQYTEGIRGGSEPSGTDRRPEADKPRIFAADDPKYHGMTREQWLSSDHSRRQSSGAPIRGTPISPDDPRIPDTLYHVTTNLQAVERSGVLLASGKGGLGGDAEDQIVSLTISKPIAVQLEKDLRFTASLADRYTGTAPVREWDDKKEEWVGDRTEWSKPLLLELKERAKSEGWEFEPQGESSYDFKDHLRWYYTSREHRAGIKDPLFFSSADELQAIDADQIGLVEVPKANLKTGAMVTDFDLDNQFGLQEVRVYGDVPLSRRSDKAIKAPRRNVARIVIPEWVEDPETLDALEREMFKFAHEINQTTADALREELIEGMEAGESIDFLADRIAALSDEWVEGWRSEMIARTESARAITEGRTAAWKSTGVVERKVWMAAGDACPFCLEMDGKAVGLDEAFFEEGDTQEAEWNGHDIEMEHGYGDVNGPPLHPNCRCVLTAELSEKGMAILKGDAEGHPFRGNQYTEGVGGGGAGGSKPPEGRISRERVRQAVDHLGNLPRPYEELKERGCAGALAVCESVGMDREEAAAVVDSVSTYTGMGYEGINGTLRDQKPFGDYAQPEAMARERAVLLDHFVRDICPKADNSVAYRGLYSQRGNLVAQLTEVGSEFEDPGFLSMSSSRAEALGFMPSYGKMGFLLKVHGVDKVAADLAKVGMSGSEKEQLLPPKTRLKVTGIEPLGGNQYEVSCAIVGVGPRLKQFLAQSKGEGPVREQGKKDGKERFYDCGFVVVPAGSEGAVKGDQPGHPFRGNQYVDAAGAGGGEGAPKERMPRRIAATMSSRPVMNGRQKHDPLVLKAARQRYATEPNFKKMADAAAMYTGGHFIPIRQVSAMLNGADPGPRDMHPTGRAPEEYARMTPGKLLIERGNSVKNALVSDLDIAENTEPLENSVRALNEAVRSAPATTAPLYRGVPQSVFAKKEGDVGVGMVSLPKVGDVLKATGVTSFSSDRNIAEAFAVGRATGQPPILRHFVSSGILFEVEPGVHALDVKDISDWRQNEFLSFGSFEVVEMKQYLWEDPKDPFVDPRPVMHIKLRQVSTATKKVDARYAESEFERCAFGRELFLEDDVFPAVKGGPGSGHFGHEGGEGGPGNPGGSTTEEGASSPLPSKELLERASKVFTAIGDTSTSVGRAADSQMRGGVLNERTGKFIAFTEKSKVTNLGRIERGLEELREQDPEAFELARQWDLADRFGVKQYADIPDEVAVWRGHSETEKLGRVTNVSHKKEVADKFGEAGVVSEFRVNKRDVVFALSNSVFDEGELIVRSKALRLVGKTVSSEASARMEFAEWAKSATPGMRIEAKDGRVGTLSAVGMFTSLIVTFPDTTDYAFKLSDMKR